MRCLRFHFGVTFFAFSQGRGSTTVCRLISRTSSSSWRRERLISPMSRKTLERNETSSSPSASRSKIRSAAMFCAFFYTADLAPVPRAVQIVRADRLGINVSFCDWLSSAFCCWFRRRIYYFADDLFDLPNHTFRQLASSLFSIHKGPQKRMAE